MTLREGSPRNIIVWPIIMTRLMMGGKTSFISSNMGCWGEQNFNRSLKSTKCPATLEAQLALPLSLSLALLLSFSSLLKESIPSEKVLCIITWHKTRCLIWTMVWIKNIHSQNISSSKEKKSLLHPYEEELHRLIYPTWMDTIGWCTVIIAQHNSHDR